MEETQQKRQQQQISLTPTEQFTAASTDISLQRLQFSIPKDS